MINNNINCNNFKYYYACTLNVKKLRHKLGHHESHVTFSRVTRHKLQMTPALLIKYTWHKYIFMNTNEKSWHYISNSMQILKD